MVVRAYTSTKPFGRLLPQLLNLFLCKRLQPRFQLVGSILLSLVWVERMGAKAPAPRREL